MGPAQKSSRHVYPAMLKVCAAAAQADHAVQLLDHMRQGGIAISSVGDLMAAPVPFHHADVSFRSHLSALSWLVHGTISSHVRGTQYDGAPPQIVHYVFSFGFSSRNTGAMSE